MAQGLTLPQIVARLFAGAGSWGFLSVSESSLYSVLANPLLTYTAPVYSAELAPPDLRGLMVGMNGVNIALGYALASYMGLAFFYSNDPVTQWRAPLGIALIWPFMMVVVVLIAPESPRWLLMKGKVEKAREVVFKLHSIKSDPENEFARAEFYQMSKQAEYDRQHEVGWVCPVPGTNILANHLYRSRCSAGLAIVSVCILDAVLHS